MTITIGGGLAPTSLHMWVTQFGWDGMVQTNSSYFQQVQDVAVVGGVVTVQVPVDGLITLTTVQSSTWGCLASPTHTDLLLLSLLADPWFSNTMSCQRFLFHIRRSHSISFTRTQGIPTFLPTACVCVLNVECFVPVLTHTSM